MAISIRKAGLFIVRGVLGFCALLLVALMLVQIILVVGINILSTGRGSDFIAGKINGAIAESGYSVDFESLYYDPVRGFTVYDLSVADAEGSFLTLDKFSLAASLALGPLRTLEIYGRGGTLSLARIPASDEETVPQESAPIEPFETPDIFFRKIILSNLSFDRVHLAEAVAGTAYDFSPAMQAHILLQETIDLSFKLDPGLPQLAQGLSAPQSIDFFGAITPSTLDFDLKNFSVTAADYGLIATGRGNVSEGGDISVGAKAWHNDLVALTGNAVKEISADISVNGPLAGPAFDLAAEIITENLKERGLSDINIALKTSDITDGMRGNIKIETAFHDDPVTIESALAYEAPLLQITDIKGAAPELSLTGGGIFSTEKSIFDGKIAISANKLAHYSELAGVALAGKLDGQAIFKESGSGEQAADISAEITNGAVDSIKVARLSAAASMASLATPWPQSASLQARSLQAAENVVLDSINADIKDAGADNYKLTIKGSGRVPHALSFDGSAMLSDLTQSIPSARDIAMAIRHGGSSVNLSGSFAQDLVDLKLAAKDFRGNDIPASLPPQFGDVRISLDASMRGAPDKPQTNLSTTLRGLGAGEYQNASVKLDATHNGETVSATITGSGTGINKLDASASFPMTLALMPFAFSLDESAALAGTMEADIDLAAISQLFMPPTQSLSGGLNANGTIAGTINSPEPTASIRLSNAAFEDNSSGIVIADLAANANLTKDRLSLSSLSATDGKNGTLNGNGSFAFGSGNTDITLQMRDFNIPRSNLANGIIGADMALKGTMDALSLSGTADINEMSILIPERFNSSIPQLNIVEDEVESGPGFLEKLTLDIQIDAHNQIFVRGWGLDAEFGGQIGISGTAAKPQFNGVLESIRGRYEEFGKRFTLERANLRFQGDLPPSPYLDIEATIPAGDVTGAVLLSGPVTNPSIKFASTPPLPDDEVLSRILFGKNTTNISPFQAVQLAQTVQRFSGEGGGGPSLDPLGMIRSATGLDDISVEADESGATNVEAGKYLSDNVYLELSKGKAENSGAATIQIEVTPSINIESRIGQDAQGGGGVFWRRDY